MHHYSARVHAVLRDRYRDGGPDILEFCDYLGEGFVTIQAQHTLASWLERTLVCVRLHTTSEIVSVLNGHTSSEFGTAATHDAERYALHHADRLLWSGGDVYETYRRFYGPTALARGERIPDAFLREGPVSDGVGHVPIDGETLRLLYVGRMERRKGVQNLLRAVTALEHDNWSLTLIGGDTDTGPSGTSIREQARTDGGGRRADRDP